ncbi:MAG: methyltransferase domain-containing protein [Chthoniobacteraceae bacterium]
MPYAAEWNRHLRMISIIRHADLAAEEAAALEKSLAGYYANPPHSYYEIADQAATQYQPNLMPFHCDLVGRVEPGWCVLELGCGSAHLCPQIEARGGHYTGADHSLELMSKNRKRFSGARFFPLDAKISERFDVVASLYTIEHVVNPTGYLEKMWSLCREEGLLAVICPEFVDGEGFPPSLYYGRTPRRLRQKLASFAFVDAFQHALDLLWFAPRWKRRARSAAPGAFWINTRPSELQGQTHGVDTDAVHLPRMTDITAWMQNRGANIIATSETLPAIPTEILRYNCYVLARKP